MTQPREMRIYFKPGRHTRGSLDVSLENDNHVILFAPRGFHLEGLGHLAKSYTGEYPVTVVTADCSDAHTQLEKQGYTRGCRPVMPQERINYYEREF